MNLGDHPRWQSVKEFFGTFEIPIIKKTRSGILADGGRIAASGPSEFVRVLREGSWFDCGCTDGEYMVNFSGRYRELHGVTVRTDTPEHFMDDLKKYGYIKG